MRINSSPHSSRAGGKAAQISPEILTCPQSSLIICQRSRENRDLSHQVFHGKPQTWECHVTTVLLSRLSFGVHVWTAGRAFSGKRLTARVFFASKNCTASRLKARISFLYPPVMCYSDFWSRSNELFMFLGEKSKELRIYEKQHGGTKQWTPCLNLKSRQRETANL